MQQAEKGRVWAGWLYFADMSNLGLERKYYKNALEYDSKCLGMEYEHNLFCNNIIYIQYIE